MSQLEWMMTTKGDKMTKEEVKERISMSGGRGSGTINYKGVLVENKQKYDLCCLQSSVHSCAVGC